MEAKLCIYLSVCDVIHIQRSPFPATTTLQLYLLLLMQTELLPNMLLLIEFVGGYC